MTLQVNGLGWVDSLSDFGLGSHMVQSMAHKFGVLDTFFFRVGHRSDYVWCWNVRDKSVFYELCRRNFKISLIISFSIWILIRLVKQCKIG